MTAHVSPEEENNKIDIFDFDYTIYDGDASLDFFYYSIKKHPLLLQYLPLQLWHTLLYIVGINSRTQFKESFFKFLEGMSDVDYDVDIFWSTRKNHLNNWYIKRSHSSDVIISASPEFLLAPLVKNLGVKKLIATKMSKLDGTIDGKNCRGPEKVSRLNQELPGFSVEQCYSDSLSDLPILKLAKVGFIVKKGKIIALSDYRPNRFNEKFLTKQFLSFIIVGGLNAIIGLSFAFAVALVLDNKTVAFMIGYSLGLLPSYFLNSTLTFHNKDYGWNAFIKYCISYIPNLIVQTLCVGLLIELLHVNKAFAYTTAVLISVPVTFLMVSVFAIRDKEME